MAARHRHAGLVDIDEHGRRFFPPIWLGVPARLPDRRCMMAWQVGFCRQPARML
ncbi:hypothetical protein KN198_20570 (plasmid) [Ralstonia solanacearum]|nr:hypothetical protein KN198_20570 [Ralstonia solanacearum]